LACFCLAGGAARADRLEAIRTRGHITCGVLPGIAGFAVRNADGSYSGFDIDTCRAIAAAIFGKADRIKFVVADDVGIFRRDPEVDVVVRRLTWSLTRENPDGLMFGPITYYDGQGLLTRAGMPDARALAGKAVCVEQGEGWVGNLSNYSKAQGLDLRPVVAPSRAAAIERFMSGACAAYSADKTLLASIRAGLPKPGDYAILPDAFSKEPLAPLVRQADDRFFEIVRWTVFSLVEAEELGITSRNINEMRGSDSLDVRRFMGIVPGNGKALGLKESWAADIVGATGNYGEVFARNLGPLGLDRGLNRLWKEGGLMYAPPLR
jgi:general L-amino acid transport system substrate-binding protein